MSSKRPPAEPAEIAPPPLVHEMVVATLSRAAPVMFDLTPDASTRMAIAAYLGLDALRALRFRGTLAASGHDGWRLTARLTADLDQLCVATLVPVRARVDVEVERAFLPAENGPADSAVVIDPDAEDEPDAFDRTIDIGQVAMEELALALDPYPRAPGIEPVAARAAPPGTAPLTDSDVKPFAGLAALREKLKGDLS